MEEACYCQTYQVVEEVLHLWFQSLLNQSYFFLNEYVPGGGGLNPGGGGMNCPGGGGKGGNPGLAIIWGGGGLKPGGPTMDC